MEELACLKKNVMVKHSPHRSIYYSPPVPIHLYSIRYLTGTLYCTSWDKDFILRKDNKVNIVGGGLTLTISVPFIVSFTRRTFPPL